MIASAVGGGLHQAMPGNIGLSAFHRIKANANYFTISPFFLKKCQSLVEVKI
jgi:hypothetical protein